MQERVTEYISHDVAYACSYWPWRIVNSNEILYDYGQVHRFLQQHLLSWLEALSWLGRLSSAVTYISQLLLISQVCNTEIRIIVDVSNNFFRATEVLRLRHFSRMQGGLYFRIDTLSTSLLCRCTILLSSSLLSKVYCVKSSTNSVTSCGHIFRMYRCIGVQRF